MILTSYSPADLPELVRLFRDTVHTVCAGDYTRAQLDAWAPAEIDECRWNQTLSAHFTRIARIDGTIVGFGDIDGAYLDRLYIHRDYQGRGIAARICGALEQHAQAGGERSVTVHASITARPFFMHRGYQTVLKQRVERNNIYLENYAMKKLFDPR